MNLRGHWRNRSNAVFHVPQNVIPHHPTRISKKTPGRFQPGVLILNSDLS